MATDDERLLEGEIRRALARHRAIRDLVGRLHADGEISIEVHNKIVRLTRDDQG